MSMSTSVSGVVPADEKFNKMKALWELCKLTDVAIPAEVLEFFDHQRPDDVSVVVYL